MSFKPTNFIDIEHARANMSFSNPSATFLKGISNFEKRHHAMLAFFVTCIQEDSVRGDGMTTFTHLDLMPILRENDYLPENFFPTCHSVGSKFESLQMLSRHYDQVLESMKADIHYLNSVLAGIFFPFSQYLFLRGYQCQYHIDVNHGDIDISFTIYWDKNLYRTDDSLKKLDAIPAPIHHSL